MLYVLLAVFAVPAVILLSGIRIAQEYERGVVFRLGRFLGLRGPGLYWIIPLGIERSVMIVATTIHNKPAAELLAGEQRDRFLTSSPRLGAAGTKASLP